MSCLAAIGAFAALSLLTLAIAAWSTAPVKPWGGDPLHDQLTSRRMRESGEYERTTADPTEEPS